MKILKVILSSPFWLIFGIGYLLLLIGLMGLEWLFDFKTGTFVLEKLVRDDQSWAITIESDL